VATRSRLGRPLLCLKSKERLFLLRRRKKMIDIKLIRENPELVKENIKKKFQDKKLVLVDEVIELDRASRENKTRADYLRGQRNSISKSIGVLMANKKVDEANEAKAQVVAINKELEDIEKKEEEFALEIKKRMMVIPNILDASVPIGKDDSENVENCRYGEIKELDYEIPYHADILESICGLDKESAGRTSGNGFYFF
jgi:seryl-tRNA synthetase